MGKLWDNPYHSVCRLRSGNRKEDQMRKVGIVGAARTPIGGFMGGLASVAATELGGSAIRTALARGGIAASAVEDLVMGCVLSAGLGQAPARQAGFLAGLAKEVRAVTVNKMCGSGMQAVMTAADLISLGRADVVVAGGMESMSRAPHLISLRQAGRRFGDRRMLDHMVLDGLADAYAQDADGGGRLMGSFAEDCAAVYGISRAAQDDYALGSLRNALSAQAAGLSMAETGPVEVSAAGGNHLISLDERPGSVQPEKFADLRPVFRDGGTVTAANASSISDGAAALVLAGEDAGHPIRAWIIGQAGHADLPGLFPTAPVPAARKLLSGIGWRVADVDLWEVNEAFAVVPMVFMQEMAIPRDRMNVHGGACALGHPIGASGARIIVTLLHALEARGLRRGVAAVCIGGGEATALAIELV